MIDSPLHLDGVEKAVRKFLLLKDDDPIVRIMLAGIVANFAPDRDVPIWLVIVGDPASGKTDLTSLIQDWKYTWVLPEALTEAYFLSSKTGHRSALQRIAAGPYRLLYSQDMGGMMDLNRLYAPGILQQLRGIHDGFLKKETGLDSTALVYGEKVAGPDGAEPVYTSIAPSLRLGWLGTATPEFYPWQRRHIRLGTRFTCYLWEPFADWHDFESLSEIEYRRAEKLHWRASAKQVVQSFLDMAISRFDGYETIQPSREQRRRLSAAVKLVQRVLGSRSTTDTGARLLPRVVSMIRVMAYMRGQTRITEEELQIGLGIVMSQLPAEHHRVVRSMLERGPRWWSTGEMVREASLTRRQADPMFEALSDLGILVQSRRRGVNGSQYRNSDWTIELAAAFARKVELISPDARAEVSPPVAR